MVWYGPQDLLLFSPRVYWRLFELNNHAFWPLQLAMLAVGLALVLFALLWPRASSRWIGLVLATLWVFVSWSFLWERLAGINWAIAYVVPLFGLQALMLAVIALSRGDLVFRAADSAGGLLLVVAGLLVYPLLPFLFGRPLATAEIFGIAPDPTVIVTLGFLLASRAGSALFATPIFWLLLSGVTLRTMSEGQAWVPLSAAGIVIAMLALRLRRPGGPPGSVPGKF